MAGAIAILRMRTRTFCLCVRAALDTAKVILLVPGLRQMIVVHKPVGRVNLVISIQSTSADRSDCLCGQFLDSGLRYPHGQRPVTGENRWLRFLYRGQRGYLRRAA